MLYSWFEVLYRYPLDALTEASRRFALRDYPSWRPDHLKALVGILHELDAERAAEGSDRPADVLGTCDRCGGTGRVTVPHPRCLREGRWLPLRLTRGGSAVYYTCAVTCTCALGRWYQQRATVRRDGQTRGQMGLEEYTTLNPRWDVQLALRAEQEERVRTLAPARKSAFSEALDALLARLREQCPVPEVEEAS